MMAASVGRPGEQFAHPKRKGSACSLTGHQAEGLQGAADLIGEIDGHAHQLGPGADEMAHGMGCETLDPRFPIPARAHELGQGLGIVRVGFVALERRRRPGMPCLEAHHWHTTFLQAVIEPGRQKAGLQSDAYQLCRITAKSRGERLRVAWSFAAPNCPASLVEDMDGGLVIRYVEGSVMWHGALQR
jgi:hypothetical protein